MGKRLLCELFGCVSTEDCSCDRCGADVYGEFIELGRLEPVFRVWRAALQFVRVFTGRRCVICGRRFWRGYGHSNYTCSDECFEKWLPLALLTRCLPPF